MHLRQAQRQKTLISLVPMIDVLLILLVFFMVTSTYLDLDMIPMVGHAEKPTAAPSDGGQVSRPVLARLSGDGIVRVSGKDLTMPGFRSFLQNRIAEVPSSEVILLPSGRATTQSLASVMEIATNAGVRNLRIVRLEPRP